MAAMINKGAALVTGGATIYTCPAEMVAEIKRVHVANVDGTNSADFTASWTDDSDSDTEYKIANTIPVAADDFLNFGCGLILEAGDTFKATASADGDLVMTLAIELLPKKTPGT